MRTMLMLVLLCSLAQFAIAQPRSQSAMPEGCGPTYVCYIPDWCDSPGVQTLTESSIVEVNKLRTAFTDCPALLKLHAYGAYWMYVSIESLVESTKEIVIQLKDTGTDKVELSCKPNGNGGWEGSYILHTSPQKTGKKVQSSPTSKIKCEFEIKMKMTDKILENVKEFIFTITSEEDDGSGGIKIVPHTTQAGTPRANFEMCNPMYLVLNKPEKHDVERMYKKVEYAPGKYYCKDPQFKMEYRKPGETGAYDKNVQLTCNTKYFHVDPRIGQIAYEEDLDIRCAADAKLFCTDSTALKEDVDEAKGKVKLIRNPPNPSPGIAMELKCPPLHYLYVKGKPMPNAIIECLLLGVIIWFIQWRMRSGAGNSNPSSWLNLTNLPTDIIRNIFLKCPPLNNTRLISKNWNQQVMKFWSAGITVFSVPLLVLDISIDLLQAGTVRTVTGTLTFADNHEDIILMALRAFIEEMTVTIERQHQGVYTIIMHTLDSVKGVLNALRFCTIEKAYITWTRLQLLTQANSAHFDHIWLKAVNVTGATARQFVVAYYDLNDCLSTNSRNSLLALAAFAEDIEFSISHSQLFDEANASLQFLNIDNIQWPALIGDMFVNASLSKLSIDDNGTLFNAAYIINFKNALNGKTYEEFKCVLQNNTPLSHDYDGTTDVRVQRDNHQIVLYISLY